MKNWLMRRGLILIVFKMLGKLRFLFYFKLKVEPDTLTVCAIGPGPSCLID